MRVRPQHQADGDPCGRCGHPAARHRYKPDRRDRAGRLQAPRPRASDHIIGIDGEGVGKRPHRYVYLCAADADGQKWDVRAPEGGALSTVECLDLLLSLPRRSMVVGFAFNYDLTMMLRDLPDRLLWKLFHEKSRERDIEGHTIYKSVRWKGYRLNYMNRRFTVRRGKRSKSVWDFFKFFQSSFVKAITEWNVGTPDERAEIAAMKAKRSKFADSDAVRAYCERECRLLASLSRTLLDAHDAVGLNLKTYNGPGSSASVLLDRLGIREKRGEQPPEMFGPVACAFFGGRFECARAGIIKGPVWGYDLASAYPYACTDLPCLLHGTWKLIREPHVIDISRADLALVHWRGGGCRSQKTWGALPVRAKNGSILFPMAGAGGWAWGREFQAACRLGFDYEATEVWVYSVSCACPPPFATLSTLYRERCRLGKDGPGRVLKLALNSASYGKLAQSKGRHPPYQSWVWAGVVTSDTRAELLRAIAQDPTAVFMVATDGLYSTRRLDLRAPRNTGTGDLAKPLGVWEEKLIPDGVFVVRPGIYFDLGGSNPDTKARGLGRDTVVKERDLIMAAWKKGAESVTVGKRRKGYEGMRRFVGAKSALSRKADGTVTRSDDYGEWVPHAIDVTLDGRPKRRAMARGGRLLPWLYTAWESQPYTEAKQGPDALALRHLEQIQEEQPDGDIE